MEKKIFKGRKWIFTACDPKIYSEVFIRKEFDTEMLEKKISFYKIAHEVGKEGKNHLQGYLEMCNPCTMLQLKSFLAFLGSPHIEPAYRPAEAIDYIGNLDFKHKDGAEKGGQVLWCAQGGKPAIARIGAGKKEGRKWNDTVIELKEMIDRGKSLYELWQYAPLAMVHLHNVLKGYEVLIVERKNVEYNDKRNAEIEEKLRKQADEAEE